MTINLADLDIATFVRDLDEQGSVIVEGVLEPSYVERARTALMNAINREAEYHGGQDYNDYGMVQVCVAYDRVFLELFENEGFLAPFDAALEDTCVVYANTSSSMPPGGGNFSVRIHVDCPRFIPGYMTNMGATILLDDFTEQNGATWYLPGSHLEADAPSEERFSAEVKQVIAPAGSVWYFNTRLWHSGGLNNTDEWRHAITVNMGRGFMKQRFDLPRYLEREGVNLHGISDTARQKLGFFAQPPTSLDEYYAPAAERTFSQPYR